jgi:hypothetical protein
VFAPFMGTDMGLLLHSSLCVECKEPEGLFSYQIRL